MHTFLFVYGTLKEGFANSQTNSGVRVKGEFETAARFPLYLIGEYYIPWLVDLEREGNHVQGQLFLVDGPTLARMDELEMLNEPGWFTRRRIVIRSRSSRSTETREAFVYFGAAQRLQTETIHLGPLSEFESTHDAEYRKRAA